MAKSLGLLLSIAVVLMGCTIQEKDKQQIRTQYGNYDPLRDTLPNLRTWVPSQLSQLKFVQFNGPIQQAWRLSVGQQAGAIRGYFPDHTLVVLASADQATALRRLPFVRAVMDYPELLKIDPRLVRQSAAGPVLAPSRPMQDLMVEMAERGDAKALPALLRTWGGAVASRDDLDTTKVVHIRMPLAEVALLAQNPHVTGVSPYFTKKLFNDRSYGVVQAGAPQRSPIWDKGIFGAGQIVAVCDTGIDTGSCFFQGDKVAFYDDRTDVADHDGDGHGTHVAGSIAGDKGANGTYDTHDGMAPAAQLYVQDVADGSDLVGIPDDLGPLLSAAYDFGAKIHSNSWGDEDPGYGPTSRSVDDFVNTHRDFLALFAAGNSGSHAQTVGAPATAKNVISVGAVYGTSPDDVAYFSSHGPTSDGRLKPTLTAPGVGVVSARRRAACSTTSKTGTSMATPTLAGAAALVRQYFTDGYYPSGAAHAIDGFTPSAALLKATLLAGADDMPGEDTGGHIPANGQGFGRVHLAQSLAFEGGNAGLWVHDEEVGLGTTDSETYLLHTVRDGALKIVLTWTDPPALAGAASALVNDLDLEVVSADGHFAGNIMHDGLSSLAVVSDKDHDNVEEVVVFRHAAAGEYRVTVRGGNVPDGPQTFAVAAVGYLAP